MNGHLVDLALKLLDLGMGDSINFSEVGIESIALARE